MDKKMFNMSEFYRDLDMDRYDLDVISENNITCLKDNVVCSPDSNINECDCPLAMAFVNMQPLDSVYSTSDAYCNGTLFQSLNKPFYGGKRR